MLRARPADAGRHTPPVAKLTRLMGKALRYLPRLLRRHGVESVTIAIKVHDYRVVKVSRTHTTTFGVGADARQDPLNVAIRSRLGRLVRLLGIGYGGVNLQLQRGVVQLVEPSLSLRPPEVTELLRRLPAPGTHRHRPLGRYAARRRRRGR